MRFCSTRGSPGLGSPTIVAVALGSCFVRGPTQLLLHLLSRDPKVQEALSIASLEEAPFGALHLCKEGFGESRALAMLDDYLTMSEVDFARYGVCCICTPEDHATIF